MRIFLFLFLFSLTAQATPSQIIILRHAEKPAKKSEELSEKGFQRAAALPKVFQSRSDLLQNGLPVAFFASGYVKGDTSKRAEQTIRPASLATKRPLITRFRKGQEDEIAEEILTNPNFDGKTVVICWTHSVLPELAHALGARGAPEDWDGQVFDRFWILKDLGRGEYSFEDIPQLALPGDSER